MTITVAGNKKEYEDGLKLTELIEKEDIESPEYVTVTINDEFISKADVPETEVKDGDVVEFLYYMGGGASIMAFTNEQLERYSRHIHPERGWSKRSEKASECQGSDHWSRRTWITGSPLPCSCRCGNHRDRGCR